MAKSKKEVTPEVETEIVPTEETTPTVEVVLNVPTPEVTSPGHNTRAFRQ